MRPTPMQSTNTTHNKNFKNPKKCSFSAIAKPIEDPVNTKIKQTQVKLWLIHLLLEYYKSWNYVIAVLLSSYYG